MAHDSTAISRPRSPDLIPGYRLEKLVGKGGMGEVHRAVQLSLGRVVAVKLLASELADDESFVARFEKEAAALATLSHPNIVSIVDKGKHKHVYFLVMEFVDGQSLREVMRSSPDPMTALRIAIQVCRAIDYAHGRGVIHRDLKPENILFDDQAGGIPKVSDFGLAGFIDGDAPSKFNVTQTHVAMGTLAYMAPEQRVDAKTADGRADIYSLGVILYELLVGEVPVGNYTPPSQRRGGVDRRLDQIIDRCLKADPKARYSKVSELIAELEPLAPITFSQVPVKIGKVERFKHKAQVLARNVVRAVALGVVLAAVGVLSVSALRNRYAPTAPLSAGAALASDLPRHQLLDATARFEDGADRRRLVLGDGPDKIPVLGFGGGVEVAKGSLLLNQKLETPFITRVRPDLIDVEATSVQVSAEVSAARGEVNLYQRARMALLGLEHDPRAVLMFEGLEGRFVALVLPSTPASPMTLEWALGTRRGTMIEPVAPPAGPLRLELAVDAKGELRAFMGAGKDRRQVGEPLALGSEWVNQFGRTPTPAFGCVEGTCEFRQVRYELQRPASATPAVAVVPAKADRPAEKPTPASVRAPERKPAAKPKAPAPAPKKKATAKRR